MARKKLRKNNRKRNFLKQSFILLFLFIGIGYTTLQTNLQIDGDITVDGYVSPTLYNVLMIAAREGTYAKEYVDDHRDSYLLESSKSIYYW